MKKELKIIVIFMFIYTVNRLIKNYIDVPILGYLCRCHLNDFLGGIVFCAYFNLILILRKYEPIHKFYQIFIMIFCTGIIWEYVFPLFLSYSVSDKYDVLAYVLGGSVYYMIKKKVRFKVDGK